ncbi:cytochrome c oxidase subunit 2A [Paenibacillus ginsengihumi]|uniref:cytochrome c oxidase subunit 2A n=1 Tax=Paenibacillus ginsengihumi TaxID=431596 RepID=UPI00036A70EB
MAQPHDRLADRPAGGRDAAAKASERAETGAATEPVLKGTFASVMLLGLFLLLSWIAVFALFIARG